MAIQIVKLHTLLFLNFMFFRHLLYFLTGSAFEERSLSSADVDGYDQSGWRCYYSCYATSDDVILEDDVIETDAHVILLDYTLQDSMNIV